MKEENDFVSRVVPPGERTGPAWWFAFQKNLLLVQERGPSAEVPFSMDFVEVGIPFSAQHYLGELKGVSCYGIEIPDDAVAPEGMAFEGLRKLYGRVDEDLFWLAARAVQIVEWDRTHRFCGRCAAPLRLRATERAKECPRCGLLQFPRLAPAVIVVVQRGREILMARSRHFAPGVYSVLAGFVEPGETLEEAVKREVFEETGIRLKDIRYFASQPWPFPHSLMIGFTANYAGGELLINEEEIEDAGWFTAENMPGQPGKISIARRLIEWFLAKQENSTQAPAL